MSDMMDMKNNLHLKPLPEDDGVISVVMKRIPRWKESELSGDEWRYTLSTMVEFKDWFNGGSNKVKIFGLNFVDMSLKLASLLNEELSHGNQKSVPYMVKEPNEILVCFQPGCIEPPANVYIIKQQWTYHPYQGQKMDHYGKWVRAFCERHSNRGDCDLEDSNNNYELLAYFPIDNSEAVE